MTQYRGIDIAAYQQTVDFQKVKAAGYQLVIIKATEGSESGTKYLNPYFKSSVTGANAAGVMTHAYHYFLGISESDARAEAQWFLKNLKGMPVKGYLFIDVEDKSLNKNPATLTGFVNAFLDELAKAGYSKLGIYSGLYFMRDRLVESQLRPGLLKWVAQYNDHCDRAADIWQHTSSAQVPGIVGNVDEDIAYMDKLVAPGAPVAIVKPAAPKPVPASILKQGDSGAAVLALQQRLSSVYFYPEKDAKNNGCDGVYGPKTADAVRRFQITHSCTGDGVYGPQTAVALNKAISGQKSTPASRPIHVVKSGDTLWDISVANKTTVAVLKKLNRLKSDTIYPGQKLFLK